MQRREGNKSCELNKFLSDGKLEKKTGNFPAESDAYIGK